MCSEAGSCKQAARAGGAAGIATESDQHYGDARKTGVHPFKEL
jgi:hypothetical protein